MPPFFCAWRMAHVNVNPLYKPLGLLPIFHACKTRHDLAVCTYLWPPVSTYLQSLLYTVRDCFVHEKKKMRIVKKAKITSQTFCGWRWHFGRSLHTLPNLLLNIGESPELWLSRKCFYSLDLRSFFPQALGRQENIMLIWNHFRGPDQAVFWPAKAETEK